MSVVYQADIFCDNNGADCVEFVEQGETYHNSTVGVAKGAWEVAESRGWTRMRVEGKPHMQHFCPHCTAEQQLIQE